MDWFAVDKEGLARLLERKGKAAAVLELIQNAWDEAGVTRVNIRLGDHAKRGRSTLVVEDDAPEGFADLTHSFTLFAPSGKVSDAAKRGRFNLGEKLLLAICDSAEVRSTTGGWKFTQEGRKRLRTKREYGSRIECVIRLTDVERDEVFRLIETLLPPVSIVTTLNGVTLTYRDPVRKFLATLPTEVADEDGILRRTRRQTQVRLVEPMGDETPHLYEMGLPVVEHDGRWHVDIDQKVPLTFERDNVTPAYLREVRVAVLNETHDLLTADDATSTWVKEAARDPRTSTEAITRVMTQRYGDKVVIHDPNDSEANKEAVLQGYTVITGGALSKDEWAQVKRAGNIQPAGKVTPSHNVKTSPDGKPPIPLEKWTPAMVRMADYADALAKDLIGENIYVEMHNTSQGFLAWYSQGTLSLNLQRLGHSWFNEPDPHEVDALLIHEFAHDRVSDHLSEKFHDECCRLGALLRDITVRLEVS